MNSRSESLESKFPCTPCHIGTYNHSYHRVWRKWMEASGGSQACGFARRRAFDDTFERGSHVWSNFQEDYKTNLNSKTPLFHDRAMQCATFGVGGREHGALCGLHQCSLTLYLGSRSPNIVKAKHAAEDEAEALQCAGYVAGSWQHPAFPQQEHSTYMTAAAYPHSQTHSSKHEEYAQQIQQGLYSQGSKS